MQRLKQVAYLTVIILLLSHIKLKAINNTINTDTSVSAAIKEQLAKHKNELRYPESVVRFYKTEGFKMIWLLPDTVRTPAWSAMLLFDCILQYGLNPADYRPMELTYSRLHAMQSGKASNIQKAYFDIELTDAVITLINNLHYGKLNPWFPAATIDAASTSQFRADAALVNALKQKQPANAILNVQPHTEAYANLQHHLKLLTTKFSGNNYAKPENEIHKIVINMERLRWINTTGRKIRITCEVKDGVMINYKDVYHQDKKLEKRLYER